MNNMMNENTNNNENQEVCQQCGKHCPIDSLSCNKGRSFFGVELQEDDGKHGEHGGRGEHGGYDKKGGHGGPKDDSLQGLLRQSGHYLYHRGNGGRSVGQGKILSILSEKNSVSQKELQDELGIQPGSMSELIQKLEEKQLVSRQKDENDKRKIVVAITEAGRQFAETNQTESKEEDLFAALTEEEQNQLKMLLKKMMSGWNMDVRHRRGHHKDGKGHEHGDHRHSHEGKGNWKN